MAPTLSLIPNCDIVAPTLHVAIKDKARPASDALKIQDLTPNGFAAIPVEGRHPHQGRDLFAGQGPQFGQIREQRGTQDGAHAGGAAQQVLFLPPHGALADRLSQIRVGLSEGLLQPGNVRLQALANRRYAPGESRAEKGTGYFSARRRKAR